MVPCFLHCKETKKPENSLKLGISVHLIQEFQARTEFHERNVRTVPLMTPRQIGHFLRAGAQSLHTTRWPQGMNTTHTSLSIQTLHVLSSWSLRNCSSIGRSKKKKFIFPLFFNFIFIFFFL